MNKKGYTIIEAVIAMFLVVTMVGAVFSALMAGRRAIVTSSDKEEVLYTMQSAYGMIKDCKNNSTCLLRELECTETDLRECNDLFTYNFTYICPTDGVLEYADKNIAEDTHSVKFYQPTSTTINFSNMFGILDIQSNCRG